MVFEKGVPKIERCMLTQINLRILAVGYKQKLTFAMVLNIQKR